MNRSTVSITSRCLALLGMAVLIGNSALAQPAGQTNYQWSAGGDKATWSQVANWTQGRVPLTDGTTWQIDTFANAGGSLVPINIASTDVVNINDAIFGPLWGQTLNVYGSVACGFGQFVWGDLNGPVTTLNIQTNGSLQLKDTLAFGTAWWFPGGPNVVLNVHSNGFLGVAWLQFGARMNLLGGTVSVTNGLNTGTATGPVFVGGLDTDATRSINLTAGSRLVLPAGYTTTVNDWIARGILLVYGAPNNASEIVIDEAHPDWPGRTVVTTSATNSNPILAIHITVPRTNVYVGGYQRAKVLADYATSTGADITDIVPITYQSSATNILTVAADGRVRAVGVGSAQIKAIVGSLTNAVMINVSNYTSSASLAHRYSFSEPNGSVTTADSIGGSAWDGNLFNAGASLDGGRLILDGVDGYVQLPAGILTGLDAVTIETWVSFGSIITNWAVLFTFGDSVGTFGRNYISFQPHTGVTTAQSGIRNAISEENAYFTPVLDGYTNLHLVAVYHPEAGYLSIYTNGVLAAINSSIDITLPEALSTGNPLNYIGRSLWSADPYLPAWIDEFRIYSGPMTAGHIKANNALGPNQFIGTSTNVALTAKLSGGNVVISWPVNSALVNLMSSPVLGTGAVWSAVNGTLAVNGSNYEMTLPGTAAAQFFRLQ